MNLSTLIKILAGTVLLAFIAIAAILVAILFTPPIQREVKVPDLLGKDFETASKILASHNLRVKKTYRFSSEREGYIFNQNPLPGRKVKPRREIEVFVSRGLATVVVPELIGLTISEARSILSHRVDSLGEGSLRVGHIAYAHSTEVKEGQVLAQSPLAKTTVQRGTPVSLLVSQGPWPEPFQMPNLVGMRIEDALQRVEGYGLVIRDVKEAYKAGELEDVVIDQRPSEGYQVIKGDLVDLVISRWAGWGHERPKSQIIRFTVPPGFLPKEVRVVIVNDQGEQEIYNKQEPPGHILEIPVEAETTARVLIYVDGELVEEGAL